MCLTSCLLPWSTDLVLVDAFCDNSAFRKSYKTAHPKYSGPKFFNDAKASYGLFYTQAQQQG